MLSICQRYVIVDVIARKMIANALGRAIELGKLVIQLRRVLPLTFTVCAQIEQRLIRERILVKVGRVLVRLPNGNLHWHGSLAITARRAPALGIDGCRAKKT